MVVAQFCFPYDSSFWTHLRWLRFCFLF